MSYTERRGKGERNGNLPSQNRITTTKRPKGIVFRVSKCFFHESKQIYLLAKINFYKNPT